MDPLLLQTRRHFFHDCALGLGSLALTSLLSVFTSSLEGFQRFDITNQATAVSIALRGFGTQDRRPNGLGP